LEQNQMSDPTAPLAEFDLPPSSFASEQVHAGIRAVPSAARRGGVDAGKKFVDRSVRYDHMVTIREVRPFVNHLASTTHSQSTPAARLVAGGMPSLVHSGVERGDILPDLPAGSTAAAT
jgi:O-acetylhomoserine (thiol)-lyase